MTMTDPVADMLTRIRNAIRASHEVVNIPSSKLKINVAKVLKSEGYIKNFRIISDGQHRYIRVFLKYDNEGNSVIEGLQRISKPGRRVYEKYHKVPKALNGYGINIISTSKGLMTDGEARQQKTGGEILCAVW
ncbi:MAG: 30S ribosomal protein S8 [Deltaproteobacteria bacterium]|nr:30S ribosomal protein S8 [Deltaproteobacteria bacterium]